MWRTMLLILLSLAGVHPLFSDSGPVQPFQSGTVKPFEDDVIALKNEVVRITLGRSEYAVEVVYTFVNTNTAGGYPRVMMGFPNNLNGVNNQPIADFKAYDGSRRLDVERKKAAAGAGSAAAGEDQYDSYETFSTVFAPGEVKTIRNSYTQGYLGGRKAREAAYVLKTGALWKGRIESLRVYVNARSLASSELAGYSAYENSESAPEEKYPGLVITPPPARSSGNVFELQFEQVKPDFNVRIVLPPSLYRGVTATSWLPSDRRDYFPENLIDNDPSTAWVEGVKGDGRGEKVTLHASPSFSIIHAGFLLVERIGIVNGFAANRDLFSANNRVKKLKVGYSTCKPCSDELGPVEAEPLVFDLEDSMEMQFLRFAKPLPVSNLTVEILEVFKGAKYDDTCISELQLFVK